MVFQEHSIPRFPIWESLGKGGDFNQSPVAHCVDPGGNPGNGWLGSLGGKRQL